ncbi:MAG: LamG domain-containing protein [Elainellaceae cyanobacterium]
MPPIPPSAMNRVQIQGPFWSAVMTVLEFADPRKNWAFRNLFLDHTPRTALGANSMYLPGTLILMGFIRQVKIRPDDSDDNNTSTVYSWGRGRQENPPPVQTPEQIQTALRLGQISLLLVQADPTTWDKTFPDGRSDRFFRTLTCLAGEIHLDGFIQSQDDATTRLYQDLSLTPVPSSEREGAAHLLSAVTVHSSGVSIYGSMGVPWQNEKIASPFQVAKELPEPSDDPRAFRLTIERDRLTENERQQWRTAWNRLSRYLNPLNPQNGGLIPAEANTPNWVTLELTDPDAVPNLYWQIQPWTNSEGPRLHLSPDDLNILLSDQSPYDLDNPPTSLARIRPSLISVDLLEERLVMQVNAQKSAPADSSETPDETLQYLYAEVLGELQETITLERLNLAFDPVETPRFLRDRQRLPAPTRGDANVPVEPAVLWGFMPLEAGWAQLPVPNLTEQIYLDSGLAQLPQPDPEVPPEIALLQGAVSLGNDPLDLPQTQYASEQPWSVVLTDAQRIEGTWVLEPFIDNGQGYRLIQVDLTMTAPKTTINGLFWLSTDRPTVEDALPDFDNWVAGVRSLPLRTANAQTDVFPAPVLLKLETLTLSARSPDDATLQPVSAHLGAWTFAYTVDAAVFNRMIEENVLPSNTFSQHLPWVWQRHGVLPMVQALPLTQNQLPPSYPSASRQLVPFELSVTPADTGQADVPNNWRFGIPAVNNGVAASGAANGAAQWAEPIWDAPVPAREWRSLVDLPLVSLSLPGLVLDPQISTNATGLAADATTQLPVQYRFDLPYADELNALAQLPEPPQDPEAVSPLPDSPPPQPPAPLTRETFGDYWQTLTTQASLASAAAATGLVATPANGQPSQIILQNLIEPLSWGVQPALDVTAYPGQLTLENSTSPTGSLTADASIVLSGLSALEGISGKFVAGEQTYTLTAGSMAAHPESAGFRDQRGLVRTASTVTEHWVRTPITFHRTAEEPQSYVLTSLRHSISLPVGDRQWQLWIRDVPIPTETQTFIRQDVFSSAAEDVNDPEALSRNHNVLQGYEWRLGDPDAKQGNGGNANGGNVSTLKALSFFHLHFYPLTLERLELNGDRVATLELIGRLQLPLSEHGEELEELSNAVRITWTGNESGEFILDAIALVSDQAQFPLALADGETTQAPQLIWQTPQLISQPDGTRALEITDARLQFFLFGAKWSLALTPLVFPQRFLSNDPTITASHEFSQPPAALVPQEAILTLDFNQFRHQAFLRLRVILGRTPLTAEDMARSPFMALVRFPLLESPHAVDWESAELFDDLPLTVAPTAIMFTSNALQFEWMEYMAQDPEPMLQFLPGMHLKSGDRQTPGFAALTFETIADESSEFPQLALKTAFLETLLLCQWSQFLQTSSSTQPTLSQVFDSSAGDLVMGYTSQWQASDSTWKESLLLNGVLELKNLISFPTDMAIATRSGRTTLTLPELPPPSAQGIRPLSHIRHTIRILLNQHQIPVELLTVGQGDLLFQFKGDRPWQVLAVVEHQLIEVISSPDQVAAALQNDHRWTVVQEIRFAPPSVFKRFLTQLAADGAQTIDPVDGVVPIGTANQGYWASSLQALLNEDAPTLDQVAETTLIVEASAPQWINQTPVTTPSETTLQFLPNGSQLGILSNPQDYAPSDPRSPQWLLLTMPFLGRLQTDRNDALSSSAHPLLRDPVLLLATQSLDNPTLALALTSWAEGVSVRVGVSGFDTAAGRTWARLDPLSLEEGWFRLQNPRPESFSTGLQSILAAFPNTPARLSRSVALRVAFDPTRPSYPPSIDPDSALPDPVSGADLVWRPNSLLAQPGVVGEARPGFIGSDRGLEALYIFVPGDNRAMVYDVSGANPNPLNLQINNADTTTTWLPDGGLRVNQRTLIHSLRSPVRLMRACQASQELTIEAWIRPENANQDGPARIISVSKNPGNRNFTLAQGPGDDNRPSTGYNMRLRTTSDRSGSTYLFTADGTVTTELTHLVYTRDRSGNAILYINGQPQVTGRIDGNFSNWDLDYQLALANEFVGEQDFWLGDYHLVAIYSQALSAEQVQRHVQDGLNRRRTARPVPYCWSVVGAQIASSQLLTHRPSASPDHHAAATQLPARLTINGRSNPLPMSIAVSPYLGIDFRPAGARSPDRDPQLVSTELLCLDTASGQLLPVASRLWEETQELDQRSQFWATETHRRLAPESAIAIIRRREIIANPTAQAEGTASAVVTYRFQIVAIQPVLSLATRVFSLRSPVEQLRFREGQFGGDHLPQAIHEFELAPPQTTGVQPLYLSDADILPGSPWGLSALRLSVQYTQDQQAVIGAVGSEDEPPTTQTLWWQAPKYGVQYRSSANSAADDDLPTAGLPPLFRPGAIKTLLPVLPNPPLPVVDIDAQFNPSAPPVERWQSILPGTFRYLLTGDRPGVMIAVRNQILRQQMTQSDENGNAGANTVLVSGSIPVQHRVPRPVPLPENHDPSYALQTWASYFEPSQLLLATLAPADEAFFAACYVRKDDQLQLIHPAQRLRLVLQQPIYGKITPQWTGELTVEAIATIEPPDPDFTVGDWDIQLTLVDGNQTLSYQRLATPSGLKFGVPDAQRDSLERILARKASGDEIQIKAEVKPTAITNNFSQTLSFSLRITDPDLLPLPLRPTFVQFEDPEYNRQLASSSAHATGNLLVEDGEDSVLHEVKLSSDRREYNPDSMLFLRYDWDDNRASTGTLALSRIRGAGVVTPLKRPAAGAITAGALQSFSLSNLQSLNSLTFVQGDVLQFKLTVLGVDIILQVNIVADPVMPSTQAAYALLRPSQNAVTNAPIVECVRFAWSPMPSRVDLVCAEDLRTEVVRRRAVFQWRDSVRPNAQGAVDRYAIQKITQTGSTHFPAF